MYITSVEKTEEMDMTAGELKGKGRVTVRWLLGRQQGTPTFDMRYFCLTGSAHSPWHSHPWEHEIFIVKGRGKVRSQDKETPLKPGDAVFVPPGEYHQFICLGEELEFICLIPVSGRP